MPIQRDSTVAAEATSTNQMATILKLTYREKKENETPKKNTFTPSVESYITVSRSQAFCSHGAGCLGARHSA